MSFFGGPLISSKIYSKGFGVAGSQCDVYLFSSLTSDSLQLIPSFTGNVKVILAAPATTGIQSDILAGIQGAFTPSADPVNNPQWMQFEADVTAIDYIVDATFDGVVKYALDDVWHELDMGWEPRWRYTLDGIDDFIMLSTHTFTLGQVLSMNIDYDAPVSNRMIVDFRTVANNEGFVFISASSTWLFSHCTVTVNGLAVLSGDPVDFASTNRVEITSTLNANMLNTVGTRYTMAAYLPATVSDIKLDDGSEIYIPVNDGPGSTALNNTGSGSDATPVNFNDEGWNYV